MGKRLILISDLVVFRTPLKDTLLPRVIMAKLFIFGPQIQELTRIGGDFILIHLTIPNFFIVMAIKDLL